MKNKIIILLTCGILIFMTRCGSQQNEQTVSGTIQNASGQEISLIGFNMGQADTIASKTIGADGSFSIPVDAGALSFYGLGVGQNGTIVLAIDSTQSPVIEADTKDMNRTYEVSNSPDSKDLRDLFVISMPYERRLDSLMTALRNSAKKQDKSSRLTLSTEYNDLSKEYRNYLHGKIDSDSTSIANFSILQRLDPKQDYPYFIKVRNGLEGRLQGNYFYDQLANKIGQMESQKKAEAAFGPGAEAPDIVLPNPEGKDIALSSLRGNYVLIDFWASWCKPCRRENPNVVKLYQKYSKDNFEIYGVSLDKKKANWVKAIADDHLSWIHVSDLKFWNSAAARLYNIRTIPHTVLVDPDGKIVATKLRGASLETKLEELFGH